MSFGRIAVVLAAAACASALGAQPRTANDSVAVATIDTFLTRAAAYGLSGAIIIARGDDVLIRKGYGLADRERGTPITPETPFFIGSLAKQFTAAAVLRLVADGKLALSDTLGAFFSDVPADKRAITLRQLLSHTSGLPYLPSAGLFGRGSRDSVMREMLSEPITFPPGSRYDYSTPGYILLAGVIEHAAATTYEQYLRSMFDRAGLRSTGFVGERERWSASAVRSYADDVAESALSDVPALPRFVGASSIVSTVDDLFAWYGAIARGNVVPSAERDSLFAPVMRLAPNLQGALTWIVAALPTGVLRQAAGDIGGFNAEIRNYVDEHLTVVFASNARVRGRGYRELVMNSVARMSRGERIPAPPAVTAMTASDRAAYAGTYAVGGTGSVRIWESGDSVLIGALDGGGLAALAGHTDDQARRARELDERAHRFLSALAVDTLAAAFMHWSMPADARRTYLEKIRGFLGDSLDERAVVIGTAADSPTGARSYVRLRRKDGVEVVSLVWSGGMIVGVEPSGQVAYTLSLRRDGDGSLVSFDLFTGHLVRVTLTSDRELSIESNGVAQRAIR